MLLGYDISVVQLDEECVWKTVAFAPKDPSGLGDIAKINEQESYPWHKQVFACSTVQAFETGLEAAAISVGILGLACLTTANVPVSVVFGVSAVSLQVAQLVLNRIPCADLQAEKKLAEGVCKVLVANGYKCSPNLDVTRTKP